MEQNTRLALFDTSGLLKQIIDVLSGKEGRYWMSVFKKALRRENPFEKHVWPIWKTVTTATLIETFNLLDSLKEIGFKIGKDVEKMAEHISSDYMECSYDLVKITPEELGFNGPAYIKDIYERAIQYDLALCSGKVAITLRPLYQDQPQKECLIIAMQPIENSIGKFSIFNLHVDDGIFSIGTSNCEEKSKYGAKVPFIFCLRK